VLFLCAHNSARSQTAERLLRNFAGDRFEVYSADKVATVVKPQAIEMMSKIGRDVSG
jgi:protein-tyrosine-phosphatase